ncbi:MAG: hypothetical protein NT076_02625 [Candidatus Pacearchaeota archaeon]|nr:hypothetical protein [Candidatus Pacearchaeota archaeon]
MQSRRKFLLSLATGLVGLTLYSPQAYSAELDTKPRIITEISKENTVNTLFDLSREYLGTSQETIAKARKTLVDICNNTSQALAKEKDSRDPRAFFLATARAVENTGIQYDEKNIAFTEGLAKKSTLKCDTLSFAYIAVGHELQVPVKGIRLPRHFAVRIGDLNFDPALAAGMKKPQIKSGALDAFATNEEYIELFKARAMRGLNKEDRLPLAISKTHLEENIYLSPLEPKQLISDYYMHIEGMTKIPKLKQKLLSMAIRSDGHNEQAIIRQSSLLLENAHLLEAINYLEDFTKRNSKYGESHYMLGRLYMLRVVSCESILSPKVLESLKDKSKFYIKRATELIPENIEYRETLKAILILDKD